MGLIDKLPGKHVYLDTNIFIYLIEGNSVYRAVMSERAQSLSEGAFRASSSHIVMTGILPPLVKRGDETVIAAMIGLLRDSGPVSLVNADAMYPGRFPARRACHEDAGRIALHVATAVHRGCDVFLTNDAGIRVPAPLTRLPLSDQA